MAGAELRFTRPLISIGRELDNDAVIEDSRVSRHHAQLLFQHGRYILRDLGSTNGTFVNTQPIEAMMLTSGDRLSLGGVEVQFTVT
jgi:pSer/pThr/pTyr-binding forkhead associated (FHA) protein